MYTYTHTYALTSLCGVEVQEATNPEPTVEASEVNLTSMYPDDDVIVCQ